MVKKYTSLNSVFCICFSFIYAWCIPRQVQALVLKDSIITTTTPSVINKSVMTVKKPIVTVKKSISAPGKTKVQSKQIKKVVPPKKIVKAVPVKTVNPACAQLVQEAKNMFLYGNPIGPSQWPVVKTQVSSIASTNMQATSTVVVQPSVLAQKSAQTLTPLDWQKALSQQETDFNQRYSVLSANRDAEVNSSRQEKQVLQNRLSSIKTITDEFKAKNELVDQKIADIVRQYNARLNSLTTASSTSTVMQGDVLSITIETNTLIQVQREIQDALRRDYLLQIASSI